MKSKGKRGDLMMIMSGAKKRKRKEIKTNILRMMIVILIVKTLKVKVLTQVNLKVIHPEVKLRVHHLTAMRNQTRRNIRKK